MATDLKINIGDFFLTDNGTADGESCDLNVEGDLSSLKQKWWGNASRNARGNAEMNLTAVAGVDLTIQIPMLSVGVFNGIAALFDDCLDNDVDFDFRIDGGAVLDFDGTADPNPDNSITWKSTIEGMVLDVEIRVITRGIEEEEE